MGLQDALVISHSRYNEYYGQVTIILLSSSFPEHILFDSTKPVVKHLKLIILNKFGAAPIIHNKYLKYHSCGKMEHLF